MHGEALREFKHQIFLIPDYSDKGYMVYAPTRGACFWVDSEYERQLSAFLSTDILPEQVPDDDLRARIHELLNSPSKKPASAEFQIRNHLVLILSEICNFGCMYCYAQDAHCTDTISWESVCKAVDILLDCPNKKVRVTFIGGGEPLATYPLLQDTVEYIEKNAAAVNKDVAFSLTTNASLITPERAKWLYDHHFRVSVSFDILPEIQNMQRPFANGDGSFEHVHIGINNLLQAGITPRFRATITTANVHLMQQMVQFSVENYPKVKALHFEHVSDNIESIGDYFAAFIDNYFSAKHFGEGFGVVLSNSVITSLYQLKSIFCAGEFCVVPNGDFVSCHRVSSERDALYKHFRVGRIGSDPESSNIKSVGQTRLQNPVRCTHCYAKWNCAGGCAYNQKFYNEEQLDLLCKFTKEMLRRELADKLQCSD